MKITNIESFVVDGGWRPWIFVKVETDEGVTGYGECSDGRNPNGIVGCIRDLNPFINRPRSTTLRNAVLGYDTGFKTESRRSCCKSYCWH